MMIRLRRLWGELQLVQINSGLGIQPVPKILSWQSPWGWEEHFCPPLLSCHKYLRLRLRHPSLDKKDKINHLLTGATVYILNCFLINFHISRFYSNLGERQHLFKAKLGALNPGVTAALELVMALCSFLSVRCSIALSSAPPYQTVANAFTV